MKRVFVFALLAGLVLAIPMSHVFAAKEAKVEICHVNSANSAGSYTYHYHNSRDYTDLNPNDGIDYNRYDYFYGYEYTYTYHLGRVIEVAESAVDAHVAHGDSASFNELTDYWADWITSLDDIDYSNTYEYSYTSPGHFVREFERESSRDGTSGVNKNANCWWRTYERVNL